MKKIFVVFSLSFLLFSCNNSDKKLINTQLLYNGDCSYFLSEPTDWIANPKPDMKNYEIPILVSYEPIKKIKHNDQMGIYSQVIFKDIYKSKGLVSTIEGFLKGEKETALERGEEVFEAESVKTKDKKIAQIRKYYCKSISEYYSIAYIDEPKFIITITFSTYKLEDLNNNYSAFLEIVNSYKYSGMTVIDDTRKNP